MNKLIFPFLLILIFQYSALAQKFDLKQCQKLAIAKNPIVRQSAYYESITALNNNNTKSIYYPQIKIEGQASYQSDVFTLPIKIPQFPIPEVPKTQYQATAGIYQTIYEGGLVGSSLESNNIEQMIHQKNIEVSNQKIKEIISDLYFNGLMLQESRKVYLVTLSILQDKRKQMEALVAAAAALKSSLDAIDIQILKTEQMIDAIESDKRTILSILANWIEDSTIISTELITPIFQEFDNSVTLNRPEHDLYKLNQNLFESKKDVVKSQVLPNVSAFVRAGWGSPNPFNFFETDLSFFYTAGIKLSWTAWDWWSNSRSREILEINKKIIETEKDNFDKTLSNSLIKDKIDADKYKGMIEKDNEMIEKQKRIVEWVFSELKGGVATTTDYITEMNNLTTLQLNLEVHKIQQIGAVVDWMTQSGY